MNLAQIEATQKVIPILQEERTPAEMTPEELLQKREELVYQREVFEAGIQIYNEELLARLDAEKTTGMVVGDKAISKTVRVSFSTTLEEAREYGAIKEAVDNDTLKKLHNKGIKIPGVKTSVFVMVREIKQHED